VLDSTGKFLVDTLVETPSKVREGPTVAVQAMADAFDGILERLSIGRASVRAVGLDTPGPATAEGVLAVLGGTNFGHVDWRGFDVRSALEKSIGLPVVYNNDANAAALYAHHRHFGPVAASRSSVAAIVGTGLGGGVVEGGRVITGSVGMAGELGHVPIPLHDLLDEGQPMPRCNCGQYGDVESVASLTGIEQNLLPWWLGRFPDHPLVGVPIAEAAKQVRSLAENGDPMSLAIFEQQAKAIGHLFTILANITDPDAYFLGGGVVEAAPHFRDWFLTKVRATTVLRAEQERVATFAVVPDLDMAGARGAAIAALDTVRGRPVEDIDPE
jgi:predicted NBD/HSP70 family sugar kinase